MKTITLDQASSAAAHDKWFREEVAQALREAADPNTEWVSNGEAEADWAKQRAELLTIAAKKKLANGL